LLHDRCIDDASTANAFARLSSDSDATAATVAARPSGRDTTTMKKTPLAIGTLLIVLSQFPGAAPATSLQLPQSGFMPEAALELATPAQRRGTLPDERIFQGRFELPVPVEHVTTYDDLQEAFAGTTFHHDGVTYREVNEVSGIWPGPENEPFGPGSIDEGGLGNQFVIEDATFLFNDFPDFGSAPNVLNFGDLLFANPGPNLSLGPLASAWMDLDEPAESASMALVYYENGPWGGLELHLDAYLGDVLVGSDMIAITSDDPQGRDNVTTGSLSVESARFDTLHLYSRRASDGEFTAPRVMLDDLTLVRLRYLDTRTTTYDDLAEAFVGTGFEHDGVGYRDLNEVSGFWPGPEGEPFGPGAIKDGGIGNQFIIEDATFLFNDFPEFGSAPNVLNFGDLQFATPGPNLSIGPLASAWMDLEDAADAVEMAVVFYENGPWGGIELRLDAYLEDTVVGSDMIAITSNDPDGRDNVAADSLSIAGTRFDTLHLYGVRASDGEYTVPRVMVDDLRLSVDITP
jgi:hypothetical protein